MNPNRALWEKGDFTKIAAFMRESGETIVRSLGMTPPLRVLDLGCGDGTTAILSPFWAPRLLESTLPATLLKPGPNEQPRRVSAV